jgi:hypothetical protein
LRGQVLMMTPNEDESLDILSNRLKIGIPTQYFRFGDGQIQAILQQGTNNCDGELYTKELGINLLRVVTGVMTSPNPFVGDYGQIIDREKAPYKAEWESLSAHRSAQFLHYEAPLLMRTSKPLLDFYKTIRQDTRKKAFLGPKANEEACKLLDAQFIEYPRHYQSLSEIANILDGHRFDILISGAGMGSAVPIYDDWIRHRERTYINVGSAFDPLFTGRTRSYQLGMETARAFFKELL